MKKFIRTDISMYSHETYKSIGYIDKAEHLPYFEKGIIVPTEMGKQIIVDKGDMLTTYFVFNKEYSTKNYKIVDGDVTTYAIGINLNDAIRNHNLFITGKWSMSINKNGKIIFIGKEGNSLIIDELP